MTVGLSGVRVVDFGHHVAGPMAAVLLADAGADVVHVDRPGGVASAGIADAFLHRGKQRITLDLTDLDDLDAARSLVSRADVVIENFRPGVMDRLGIGAAASLADNPRLVYCSLPGFAADDERAGVRAWEGILHAATAGYRPLNEHWDPTGRQRAVVDDPTAPIFTPVTTASNFGAMLGATMIVAALIARDRSGRGQRIELPLAEAMIEAYSTMMRNRVYDNRRTADNIILRDLSYRCADGGMVDMSPHPKFVFALLRDIGVAENWQRRGFIDLAATTFDLAHRDEIQAEFADLIASRTAAEWEAIALRLKTPLAMVRTPSQWLASQHAAESGAVVELDDPNFGRVVMPGAAFDLVGSPTHVDAAHARDSDRSSILEWLSAHPQRSATGAASPVDRPLDGLRAIDMTQAVAGPTAARLLADLGADVIKVGSPTPGVTDGIVGHMHRGKRTILLDTTSTDGRDVLNRLICDSDVLVTNFTASAATKYGLDHETLSAINPELVYCSISAYGLAGPWATRRAYENQCNAATGMSWSYGSPFGWTLYQPTPVNDAATGILAALATVIALYGRSHGGHGQKVGTSLAQASTWHQATTLVRSSTDGPDLGGRSAYGPSALHRLYRTSDRWIFLAAAVDDRSELADASGVDLSAEFGSWFDPEGALAEALSSAFAKRTALDWETSLRAAGVEAQTVQTLDEATAYLATRGLVYFEPGLDGETLARPGIGAWLSETPPSVGRNPGAVGLQALEILHELGLTDDQIASLAEAGTVCLPDRLPQVTLRA